MWPQATSAYEAVASGVREWSGLSIRGLLMVEILGDFIQIILSVSMGLVTFVIYAFFVVVIFLSASCHIYFSK